MEKVLDYIKEKYHPIGLIVYGSFADYSNNEHSDFDALVITDDGEVMHDNTIVNDTALDVFIYPKSNFCGKFECKDYIQVYDGRIILDTKGIAEGLMLKVNEYMNTIPSKTREEKRTGVEWCEKMLMRTLRNDAEGFFRWHWLLIESLEIYCDLMGYQYKGPKKSIRHMAETDCAGYNKYSKALSTFAYTELAEWISYLKEVYNCNV
jgi:hypothetical protein